MARPTTRFGRWWQCRGKHLRKYWRQQGRKYQKDRSYDLPDRPYTPPYILLKRGKQAPPRISKKHFAKCLREVYPILYGPHWTMEKPGKGKPPRPKLTDAYKGSDPEWKWGHGTTIQMYARPVELLGRKIGAKGGKRYIVFMQDLHFFFWGFYAEDDALGRHPTEQDIIDGGGPYPEAGIWPRGG